MNAEEELAGWLRLFQERCEALREAGRNGSIPTRAVSNGHRRLERLQAKAIVDRLTRPELPLSITTNAGPVDPDAPPAS